MTRSTVRSSLLTAALCSALLTAPVHAAGAVPLAQSLTGEAKADYESARLLFDDGDSPGALAKFSHAYALSHEPQLLWNMAVCEKELRHYARTATLIGRYLKESGHHLSADQQRSAVETQNALRAFYAGVRLNGAPSGAKVLVDGASVGQAPLTEPLLLDLGTHQLRVELPGFEAFESKLEVPGGQDLEISVILKPAAAASASPARLSVMSAGVEDIVAVDGKVVGSQRWEGIVTTGEHVVRVTAAHKQPYESHVQLGAGSTRSLQVTLEDETHGPNLWLWVAGGAALVAGAAVGGYFLLKPADAPGPHPEGKLATVYLSLGVGSR